MHRVINIVEGEHPIFEHDFSDELFICLTVVERVDNHLGNQATAATQLAGNSDNSHCYLLSILYLYYT